MGVWIETVKSDALTTVTVVTPFVGVWIETYNLNVLKRRVVSHPSWVCGLKLKKVFRVHRSSPVTPFVGVWIET